MSSSRVRLQVAVVLFILLPAAAGIVAVHASATCERFVRTYVTKPVRNRVSKATAEAWAKWRIAHPNWKPNPNLHRPKYVMTQEEAVDKVDFACTIPLVPTDTELFFKTADLEGPPPVVDLPPMDGTQIAFPDEIPPEVAEVPPPDSWPPLATFIPPALGGPPGTPELPVNPPPPPPLGGEGVPEPLSLLMVASGMACLGLLRGVKGLRAAA